MRLFQRATRVAVGGVGTLVLMADAVLGQRNETVGDELDKSNPGLMSSWQGWMLLGVVGVIVVCVYRYRPAMAAQELELRQLEEQAQDPEDLRFFRMV